MHIEAHEQCWQCADDCENRIAPPYSGRMLENRRTDRAAKCAQGTLFRLGHDRKMIFEVLAAARFLDRIRSSQGLHQGLGSAAGLGYHDEARRLEIEARHRALPTFG